MSRIIMGVLALAVAIVGTLTTTPAEAMVAEPVAQERATVPTRPCRFEDSTNCVWDARHMGFANGGRSFYVTGPRNRPRVTYISHRRAHRLLFGTNILAIKERA